MFFEQVSVLLLSNRQVRFAFLVYLRTKRLPLLLFEMGEFLVQLLTFWYLWLLLIRIRGKGAG